MSVTCHSCKMGFADYEALALHISSSKKGHRKGKKWAAKYLMRSLLQKQNNHQSKGLTEDEKASKKEVERVLSGSNESVITFCPQCHNRQKQVLPIEYTRSENAWKIKDSLVVPCSDCGR